eukprot:gene2134-5193_t
MYCLKDTPWCTDLQLGLHHVACVLGTSIVLFQPAQGACLFILGTGMLEFGSLWTNLIFLKPTSMPLLWACVGAMSVSNLFAAWCAVTMSLLGCPFFPWKFYLVTCTAGLALGRQRATMGYITTYRAHGTLLPNAAKQAATHPATDAR